MQKLTDAQKKAITLLANAITDEELLASLRKDPETLLRKEGVQGDRLYIPDDDCLDNYSCILNCLSKVWEKRS